MAKSTKVELVTMLEAKIQELERVDPSSARIQMIETLIGDCKSGMYHDFESQVLAAPKMQLFKDLMTIGGMDDIVNLVVEGEFDEEPIGMEFDLDDLPPHSHIAIIVPGYPPTQRKRHES